MGDVKGKATGPSVEEIAELAPLIRRQRKPRGPGKPFAPGNKAGKKFVRGQPSPNPGGRPKDAEGYAARCREITIELVEELRKRALKGKLTHGQVEFLKNAEDRGFGKVPQKTELTADVTIKPDPKKYTTEELEFIRQLRLKGKP